MKKKLLGWFLFAMAVGSVALAGNLLGTPVFVSYPFWAIMGVAAVFTAVFTFFFLTAADYAANWKLAALPAILLGLPLSFGLSWTTLEFFVGELLGAGALLMVFYSCWKTRRKQGQPSAFPLKRRNA